MPLGLVEFVEAARDRALAGGQIRRWHVEAKGCTTREAHAAQYTAAEVAEEVCLQCLGGQFGHAVNTSYPYDLYVDPEFWEDLEWLDECPAWVAFHEAVCIAERIDSLLTTLEREGLTRQIARDCRFDLDLLLVLADFCADADLPHAAAEARHLHGLVRQGF